MQVFPFPVTDNHIHIDPINGRGAEAVKDFRRAGGTHMMLVTKPSWSLGIHPVGGEDFREVFDMTLAVAEMIRDHGVTVFPVLGVHPAEIGVLTRRMPLDAAETIMTDGLTIAAEYVAGGSAVAIKSGRPHYPVDEEVWDASNRVLLHALEVAADTGCALQIHSESGPCADVAVMAEQAGMPVERVVKHFAVPETPLTPSLVAKHEAIPALAQAGRRFMMESDYMDDNSRPGAVIGPKSVPRFTRRLCESGSISEEAAWRIHAQTPSEIYGIDISLP